METPRKALSLCSLVKSTWYKAEFSGTLRDPPAEGVKETPVMVALKERRLVVGGGIKGMVRSVSASVALSPGPLGVCP